ncbi:UvrD-helicase domain-containing protein [Virgibacillus ndiopensis]|uniref:UvrD-helicase domain-containing protein n=1 Tax=Virgibacillus ndiopensis TaxID=2004408 RepID=UPI000C06CF39|nr:UvrD-helicase domain-containing protein [Virgibacillus ndiopensis]
MTKVINLECQNCDSKYFKSDNTKHSILYRCVGCGLQLNFPGVSAYIILNNDYEESLFEKNHKSMESNELKEFIYKWGKIHQRELNEKEIIKKQMIEKEKKEKQLALERQIKLKRHDLYKVLSENYYVARDYWNNNLREWISEDEFKDLTTHFVLDWFRYHSLEKPDYEQAKTIANVWDNVQVVARAGSGKTRTIINRSIFLIKHCHVHPSEILILAFNKKAAMEVTNRLKKVLKEDIPQAMTYHALAYGIVHPEENMVYDELDKLEKSSSVQNVINSNLDDHNYSNRIKNIMMKYFREDWDRFISLGYNLSKDEMLKYRRSLPYIGLDGKYYKSMGEKRIADFLFEHDVPFYYEWNFRWDGINYKPDFTILKESEGFKGIVIEFFGMSGDPDYDKESMQKILYWSRRADYDFISMWPDDVLSTNGISNKVGKILETYFPSMRKLSDDEIWHRIKNRSVDEFSIVCKTFIERSRKLKLDPNDIKKLVVERKNELTDLELHFLRVIWKIYSDYLDQLSANKEEDFDGLLYRAIDFVKQGHTNWTRKKGSGNLNQIKYLFIDEFQDFSLLFNELISSIRLINNEVKLFCVGDDWQAINGFAGSDLKYFYNFKEDVNVAIKMNISTNYRSAKKIVQAGNQLMMNEGKPSDSSKEEEGTVNVVNIDLFNPSDHEKQIYKGDKITPALIRLVKSQLDMGQSVTLLSRRKSSIPFYNIHNGGKGDFREKLINTIRNEFPVEQRDLIKTVDTVHSFKGREDEVIILMDAVSRSFPLIHPRNVFYKILGHTIDRVYDEEKRLFYVGLTRAKNKLIIITDSLNRSPFLNSLSDSKIQSYLDINTLSYPLKEGSSYRIIVSNKKGTYGTIAIKDLLKSQSYTYHSLTKSWYKIVGAQNFSEANLFKENWVGHANDVAVEVIDEFDQQIVSLLIINGQINKDKSVLSHNR